MALKNQMCTTGQQDDDDHGLEPRESRSCRLTLLCLVLAVDGGFDRDGACGEQHGIDGGEIVILSVKNKKSSEADQVAPAQRAVRLEARREEQGK